MGGIGSLFSQGWGFLSNQLQGFSFRDIADISAVAVILYYVMKFLRDRRAAKLALGVFLMLIIWLVSSVAELVALEFIMEHIFQIGVLALVIIFQPELRSALERVGGSSIRSLRAMTDTRFDNTVAKIDDISEAVVEMARDKTGALIVMERTTRLGDIIDSGTPINADISPFLLRNIFFNKAPLHDGAVVIRDGRICAAGCFLPLSQNQEIIRDLGTRHRAAIGMSENSDAVVLVVSEETGTISIAMNGRLRRNFDFVLLKRELERLFTEEDSKNLPIWKRLAKKDREQSHSSNGREE